MLEACLVTGHTKRSDAASHRPLDDCRCYHPCSRPHLLVYVEQLLNKCWMNWLGNIYEPGRSKSNMVLGIPDVHIRWSLMMFFCVQILVVHREGKLDS